jgi:hypothetical protein
MTEAIPTKKQIGLPPVVRCYVGWTRSQLAGRGGATGLHISLDRQRNREEGRSG